MTFLNPYVLFGLIAASFPVLFHLFAPPPWGLGILLSLAGFALGFVLLIAPRLLGGGGMGDVKMLAALGAWLGPKFILIAFGLGAVLAAFMAIGVMVLSTFSRGVSATQHRYLSGGETLTPRDRKQKRVLPLAVPMALATALVLVWILVKGSL